MLSKMALIVKYGCGVLSITHHDRRTELKTKRSSLNAYILYKTEESATAALAAYVLDNGAAFRSILQQWLGVRGATYARGLCGGRRGAIRSKTNRVCRQRPLWCVA